MDLDSRYGKCCRDSRNWIVEYGEVICTKCGRVLQDDLVVAVAFA